MCVVRCRSCTTLRWAAGAALPPAIAAVPCAGPAQVGLFMPSPTQPCWPPPLPAPPPPPPVPRPLLQGHSNITFLQGSYEDRQAVHLVMDLCSGGELFDKIVAKGNYSEKDAAALIRDIVRVVAHCHHMGVIHRCVLGAGGWVVGKVCGGEGGGRGGGAGG